MITRFLPCRKELDAMFRSDRKVAWNMAGGALVTLLLFAVTLSG